MPSCETCSKSVTDEEIYFFGAKVVIWKTIGKSYCRITYNICPQCCEVLAIVIPAKILSHKQSEIYNGKPTLYRTPQRQNLPKDKGSVWSLWVSRLFFWRKH